MTISAKYTAAGTLFLILALGTFGQTSNPSNSAKSEKNSKAKELESSLKKDEPGLAAAKYEALALELQENGEPAKAEQYLSQALDIYKKQKRKDDVARVSRALGQLRESDKDYKEAASNYAQAAEYSTDKKSAALNNNDAERVKNVDDNEVQIQYLNSNIDLLESEGKKEEAAHMWMQRAESEVNSNRNADAITSYEKAAELLGSESPDALKAKTEITKVLADENRMDEAIALASENLKTAEFAGEVGPVIEQQKNLASLFAKNGENEKMLALLEEAYISAGNSGRTEVAAGLAASMADHHKRNGRAEEGLAVYKRFTEELNGILAKDSSLVDAKVFATTEERIQALEKEKSLKDHLLAESKRFNWVLTGSLILFGIMLAFLTRAVVAVRRKSKRIALQSLRREMNPHFIFNSLNSVNLFIAENDERRANRYLTSYSGLMRNMMESAGKDFIKLSAEIEQLRKYLELEHMRFGDKFDFEINTDENLDPDAVSVPNMLLQPHVENAIWHGLRYADGKGLLTLRFIDRGPNVQVEIEDTGIGLEQGKAMKTGNQRKHESRGLANITERTGLLNELYGLKCSHSILPRSAGQGTVVTVILSKAKEAQWRN